MLLPISFPSPSEENPELSPDLRLCMVQPGCLFSPRAFLLVHGFLISGPFLPFSKYDRQLPTTRMVSPRHPVLLPHFRLEFAYCFQRCFLGHSFCPNKPPLLHHPNPCQSPLSFCWACMFLLRAKNTLVLLSHSNPRGPVLLGPGIIPCIYL